MAQTIAAVSGAAIEHGVLIDLSLPDPTTGAATLYRISNCYTDVVYNGNTYTALGGFLQVTDIQGDLQNTNNDISLGLSAIPAEYIEAIMKYEIKGGNIRIYRAFFDTATQQISNIGGVDQIFLRFDGIINNYAVQEDIGNNQTADVTHSITVTASSILAVLENRRSGRRTNEQSYRVYYPEQYITSAIDNAEGNPLLPADYSMSRVVALRAASFDFGKPYTGSAAAGSAAARGGRNNNVSTEQP